MWVYLRDVIDKNRFHNCVRESDKALLVPLSKNELLRIMSLETELNNTVNVTILIFNSPILFTVAQVQLLACEW